MTETITWHDATRELPDDDTTVLVQTETGSEPVWIGYHTEIGWYAADQPAFALTVTAWAEMPVGPIGKKG